MDSLKSNLPTLPTFPKSRPSLVRRLTSEPMVLGVLLVAVFTSSLALAIYLLSANKSSKSSDQMVSNVEKSEPTVTLKTEYKNPLKLESQYVNPFDTYKSPLYSLKEGRETK